MPKTHKDFPDRIEVQVPHDMKVGLLALAFLTGNGSTYAPITRNLLAQAMASAVEKLSDERRKAYNDILANIRKAYPDPKKSSAK